MAKLENTDEPSVQRQKGDAKISIMWDYVAV